MITFKDAFARRDKCIYIWTTLKDLCRKPVEHKHVYFIPAAMCEFKTWLEWEFAVSQHVPPDADVVDDEVYEWVGNAALLPIKPGKLGTLPPALSTGKPFESVLELIPFCIKQYGYAHFCELLWRCVK